MQLLKQFLKHLHIFGPYDTLFVLIFLFHLGTSVDNSVMLRALRATFVSSSFQFNMSAAILSHVAGASGHVGVTFIHVNVTQPNYTSQPNWCLTRQGFWDGGTKGQVMLYPFKLCRRQNSIKILTMMFTWLVESYKVN